MKLSTFNVLLLMGFCASAPTSKEHENSGPGIITEDFFSESNKVYTAEHDIVNVLLPFNDLNFAEDKDSSEDIDPVLFFVQADIKENGAKDYKGVYVLHDKKVKEILSNGRDVAAANDNSKNAYFAADDGVYIYDHETTSAFKYGTFDKSSIGIAKVKGSDAIYVLTDDKDLYKITNAGSEFKKIEEVNNAEQIVLDNDDNLYFLSADKQPYVYNGETVKKIEGLPKNPSYAYLVKPPFVADGRVSFIANKQSYIINKSGTSVVAKLKFKVHPSAYAVEAALIQYVAYDKKIYTVSEIPIRMAYKNIRNFYKLRNSISPAIAKRSQSNVGA